MKKLLLYILLFTYSTIMLKPAMPYISDAAAHIFWYNKHMATVHLENGKYHVHKETFEASKKTTPDESNEMVKKIMPASEHLFFSPGYIFCISSLLNTYNLSGSFIIRSADLLSDFPPPKV